MGRASRNGSEVDNRGVLALIAEQEASDLSVAAFARARGLDPQRFYNWRSKAKRAGADVTSDSSSAVAFLEATVSQVVPKVSNPLVIELPGGARAEVTSSDQLAWVAELAQLLGSARPC